MRPFQRVLHCAASTAPSDGFLLLASGPSIFSFRADTGKFQCDWMIGDGPDETVENEDSRNGHDDSQGPPYKKQKLLDQDGASSDDSSAEIVIETGKNLKPRKSKQISLPSVTNLRSTKDARYVIATSDDDKGLRVLELDRNGTMRTFSERFLPKRPSSIALAPDQSKFLCSDKFGDVYAFSVHSTPDQISTVDGQLSSEVAPKTEPEERPKPAASESTVHTQRNLKSLRDQLYQAARANEENNNEGKKKAKSHYKPVLGHVSMLTDIVCSTIESENGRRSYIITSDRDEHIRVSRGIPQAHITEGFCLEHRQFVSRLCIPDWAPRLLVSGGGDDCLFAWDWLASTCHATWPVRAIVESTVGKLPFFAVSVIRALPLSNAKGAIIIALEGVPALCSIQTDERGTLLESQVIELPSNALDVTTIPDQSAVLWSVDCIHQKGSTKETRDKLDEAYLGMHRWNASSKRWEEARRDENPLAAIQEWITHNKHEESLAPGDPKKSRELYYNIEHLRKTQNEDLDY